MKNIIKSLAIVVAVGAIAGMATYSFFSDTETSIGNTFAAGKIDLKVDSEAHYNGMVCRDGKWADESNCEEGANLVANGSFETPSVDSWGVFPNGYAGLGWNVSLYDSAYYNPDRLAPPYELEIQRNLYGTAAEGSQYAELDSYGSINISQSISTTTGKLYKLSYSWSPRPDAPSNGLAVYINGTEIPSLAISPASGSFGWTSVTYEFTATSDTTTIGFAETGTSDQLGMFIDDVEVRELTCETLPSSEFLGKTCDGTWTPTDLIPGTHKFFKFDDIKPGDLGEDTVSLHVFDNDAWGRLVIDQVTDEENGCNDPEKSDEPDCADNNNGELRENLKFSVWLDEGKTPGFQGKGNDLGEGDNIKQDDETVLITPGPINAGGETHNIWQGIAAAYTAHHCAVPSGHTDYGLCNGLSADGHMVASTDYYFGIGWELPSDVGNEVQTDIFSADMSFEVVQYRNNPNHQF
jgi:predicted ribosomally synthesized peptide with SipW-like signal peptide